MPTSLRSNERGAVAAELVVVAVPLLVTFFSFVQVAHVAAASIVVRHGAVTATRAASVISNAAGNTPGQKKGKNEDQILEAAIAGLGGGYARTMRRVAVDIDDRSTCDDYFGMVKVTVTAEYRCSVPLGSLVVCGVDRVRPITQVAQLPHQGARYKSSKGGGGCKSREGA